MLGGNFLSLVKEGFYNGLHFHRSIFSPCSPPPLPTYCSRIRHCRLHTLDAARFSVPKSQALDPRRCSDDPTPRLPLGEQGDSRLHAPVRVPQLEEPQVSRQRHGRPRAQLGIRGGWQADEARRLWVTSLHSLNPQIA
jgi:hypothetical protein